MTNTNKSFKNYVRSRTLAGKNMKRLLSNISLITIVMIQFVNAQTPAIGWQKTFGGSGDEYYGYILKLHDGNYLQYGNTASDDGDFSSNQGRDDAYMIKTDASGNVLWSKTYGGKKDDGFNQVVETANGNLVAAGYTESKSGDVSGNHGGRDGWLVMFNADGNILSQHCYGGKGDDEFDGVVKGNPGGFILCGIAGSTDGDLSGVAYHGGDGDGWVMTVNNKAQIVWQKCIGGSDFEQFTSIVTMENKIYVSGLTWSFDGDAAQNHSAPGSFDHFLTKFKLNGDVVWTACHGGSGDDYCFVQSLVATADGNLINVGTTLSNDGDVSGHSTNVADAWAPKINSATGELISQRCYGSVTRMQGLYSAYADEDGGYLLLGADASDFDVATSWDAMVIKTDADGNEVWKKTFGGSDMDMVDGLAETDDGGYLLACYARSGDGDVTNQHGGGDSWLVKLTDDGDRIANQTASESLPELRNYPNPFSTSTTISFSLSRAENISLKIFDVEGRLIRTLVNEPMSAGTHELTWDSQNSPDGSGGNEVNSGIYFIELKTEWDLKVIKLSVIR